MRRGTWLVICFVLIPLAVAVGIGIGIMFPRISQIVPGSTSSSTGPPSGVRIEELESGEKLFEVVGQEAHVFKYSGGDVEFWIELDADDKKQEFHRGDDGGIGGVPPPAPNQVIEGYFVWIRGDADDSGKENWAVGFRRDLVSAESSGVQISSALVQAEVAQSKEETQGRFAYYRGPIQVWKRKQLSTAFGGSSFTSIPTAVPTGRELCIKRITEHRGKKGEEGFEEHVIRVVCKVVSDKDKIKKGQTPAE